MCCFEHTVEPSAGPTLSVSVYLDVVVRQDNDIIVVMGINPATFWVEASTAYLVAAPLHARFLH